MTTESGAHPSVLEVVRLLFVVAIVALGAIGLASYNREIEEGIHLPTLIVIGVLLAGIASGVALHLTAARSPKLRRLHLISLILYVTIVLLSVNSLGAWLFPSGVLAALTLVLFRRF